MPAPRYRSPMVNRLVIARLGRLGDGVADTPAGRFYVPYTLPGETAEVDAWPGHPDRAHLIKIDIASPERIAPVCPHFGICGGCAAAASRFGPLPRMEAHARGRGAAQAGIEAPVDDADRSPRRGTPPRRAARAARHARRARSRIFAHAKPIMSWRSTAVRCSHRDLTVRSRSPGPSPRRSPSRTSRSISR